MSDADRAQRLSALLAKIRANAAIHVPGRPRPPALTAWPTDGAYTSFPSEMPPADDPPDATSLGMVRAGLLEDEKWSSFLATTEREILPPARAGRAPVRFEDEEEASVGTSFDTERPPGTRGAPSWETETGTAVAAPPEEPLPVLVMIAEQHRTAPDAADARGPAAASSREVVEPVRDSHPEAARAVVSSEAARSAEVADARRVETPDARVSPVPAPDPEEPTSALERAIAEAARKRAAEIVKDDPIWGNVVDSLRERRSTLRPEDGEPSAIPKALGSDPGKRGGSSRAPRDAASPYEAVARSSRRGESRGSRPDEEANTQRSAALRPPPDDLLRDAGRRSDTDAPRSISAPSRRLRPRWRTPMPKRTMVGAPRTRDRLIGYSLFAVVLAGVATVAFVFVPRWLSSSPVQPGPPLAASEPGPKVALTATAWSTSAATSASPTSPNLGPAPSSTAGDTTPDASNLPFHMGYVYFASDRPLHVYVNGIMAGETNQWLTVECEYRNIRFAERRVPSVGAQFPVWTSEGHTIIVPCGRATRLDAAAP